MKLKPFKWDKNTYWRVSSRLEVWDAVTPNGFILEVVKSQGGCDKKFKYRWTVYYNHQYIEKMWHGCDSMEDGRMKAEKEFTDNLMSCFEVLE